MNIVYLSHCVPNPPDKGERIRAHHVVRQLARRFRVHVAALARSREEEAGAAALREWCASVHVERIGGGGLALAGAALRMASGRSLMMSYYRSPALARYVDSLSARVPLDAAVAFSTPMAQFAPANVPLFLDMTDVDSEKWSQYSQLRWPGFPYSVEARRLREQETAFSRRAAVTYLATKAEAGVLNGFAPESGPVRTIENGVDLAYFDPRHVPARESELGGRRTLVFVGVLDYYPNADGVAWFAREVFPALRRLGLTDEFCIVGRNPSRAVRALSSLPGITVTGAVADVRPYLRAAQAVVAPLRLARGIQNKVLEGLAMGKVVLASPAVARTFGGDVPLGVLACPEPADYAARLARSVRHWPTGAAIRAAAATRFDWGRQVGKLAADIQSRAEEATDMHSRSVLS